MDDTTCCRSGNSSIVIVVANDLTEVNPLAEAGLSSRCGADLLPTTAEAIQQALWVRMTEDAPARLKIVVPWLVLSLLCIV